MTVPIANLTSSDLKKQSQFAPARIGAKPYIKGDYGNITALSAQKNKANQSQFRPTTGRNQLKPGVK
jgi:hypothetical protein